MQNKPGKKTREFIEQARQELKEHKAEQKRWFIFYFQYQQY
jgi:hypothetical protein